MPFVLSNKQSYLWPVKYEAPRDGGKTDTFEFQAEFKRLPQSRLDEIRKKADARELTDDDLVAEILVDWKGIKTSEGDDFVCNDVNRRILLDEPGMRGAIVIAFFDSLRGAPRKNS